MDTYFLGGHDLEMAEIARVLRHHASEVVDRHLSWADARFESYARDVGDVIARGNHPVLVEVRDIPAEVGSRVHVIDHHGSDAGRPSSLEQVLARLGVNDLTREQRLIVANDVGHIDAMLAVGATPAEIARIRAADRHAQGITAQEERAAVAALHTRDTHIPGLTIVRLPHSRTATVTDRLHNGAGGPGYVNLAIESPDELNFFGEGNLVASLSRQFGGFSGGMLPRRGYWGLQTTSPSLRRRIVDAISQSTGVAAYTVASPHHR